MSKGSGCKILGVYVTLFSKRSEAVKHEIYIYIYIHIYDGVSCLG